MLTIILMLVGLFVLFGVGFAVTGALLSAMIWLCVKLPCAIVLCVLGAAFCCTLLLIPVGAFLFKTGIALIF